jgi:c-di-GMP-binding flagellar brake protein YcgR
MAPVLRPERRQFARVRFDGSIGVEQIPQSLRSRRWHLMSEDLSEGGLRLSSPEFLPVEQRVLLDLDPPVMDAPVRVVGTVVWVEQVAYAAQWRVGVAFDELSKSTRTQVHRIVVRQQVQR